MNAMKKTVLATAVLMSMGAGAAQAAPVIDFAFTGNFVMFYSSATNFAPWSADPAQIMDNGNGAVGDPISGTMHMDYNIGGGTAAMVGTPFGGSDWTATGIALTALAAPGQVQADMLFNWGAAGAGTSWLGGVDNGVGSGACGLANCDIGVSVVFQMMPAGTGYDFFTLTSSMPAGPFAGMQPTFNGHAEVTSCVDCAPPAAPIPVPAAAWLLGSGLLGLVGVARRKVSVAA